MKIHYTREQSEKVRKELYEIIMIGRQWYIYEEIESIKDIEFEERKTTYEKIKDKINEKKRTV